MPSRTVIERPVRWDVYEVEGGFLSRGVDKDSDKVSGEVRWLDGHIGRRSGLSATLSCPGMIASAISMASAKLSRA